jgi:hypothetical protein
VSRSSAPYGMLLDRGLTLELLDLAYDIALADPDPKTNRRRLTMALRDLVSEQEAEGKTKKCLTRVWLNPPPEAADMISWAREQPLPRSARPVLHFGALLATFPFVGAVARVIGQHFQTEGQVGAMAVRAEIRRMWGDRSSVEVAARKAYTTFKHLELLRQTGQRLDPVSPTSIVVEPNLVAWLSHGVLLTRQVESQPFSSVRSAPELLGLQIPATPSRSYPLLEAHGQGGAPVVVQRRIRSAVRSDLPA